MKQKIKQTWQRLTADRKRFGFFCSLLLIALLLWARVIVITRPPRTAVADQLAAQADALAISSDNDQILVELDVELGKNPFAVNNQVFPHQGIGADNLQIQPGISTDETIRLLVQSLDLEGVMADMAIIDGSVYRQGDTVVGVGMPGQIRVEKVEHRSVILSIDDRRYELSIALSH
ncbi:MAG: hypothetical protein VX436_01565 [Planctomycetota bacterium]|nr:hypothetical protein [Planctomycetota bacterium]